MPKTCRWSYFKGKLKLLAEGNTSDPPLSSVKFGELALLVHFYLFVCFWLHCVFVAARLFLAVASRGHSSLWGRSFLQWLLLLQNMGIGAFRLSSCDTRAYLPCGMWDLPGPRIEPVFPELAVGFLTTGPVGKSLPSFLKHPYRFSIGFCSFSWGIIPWNAWHIFWYKLLLSSRGLLAVPCTHCVFFCIREITLASSFARSIEGSLQELYPWMLKLLVFSSKGIPQETLPRCCKPTMTTCFRHF